MPPLPAPNYMGPVGLTVFGALMLGLVCGLLWLVYSKQVVGLIVGLLAVAYLCLCLWSERCWSRAKQERDSESICTFARSLPARNHDTWVVRAVYEELSRTLGICIRPTDQWRTDLAIEPEDFEECVVKIAKRSRRSLANSEGNPLYGRVRTVADLIAFLEHQPKVESLSHNYV